MISVISSYGSYLFGVTGTMLAVLLFRYFLRKRLSARCLLLLWLILGLRCLVPILPSSSLSIMNLMPQWPSEASLPEDPPNGPNYGQQEILTVRDLPAAPRPEEKPVTSAAEPVSSMDDTPVRQLASGNAAFDGETQIRDGSLPLDLLPWLWLGGSIVLFLYYLLGYLYFYYKHIRRLIKVREGNILDSFTAAGQEVGAAGVTLVHSDKGPLLFGFIHPKLLLPKGYSGEEIHQIFLHELSHHRHRDNLLSLFGLFLLCLHWYHPLAWYCFYQYKSDLELACDERVMHITKDKKGYAAVLLKTAAGHRGREPLTTAMNGGKKEIKRRLRFIAAFKKPGIWGGILAAILLTVLALVFLTEANKKSRDTDAVLGYHPETEETVPDRSKEGNGETAPDTSETGSNETVPGASITGNKGDTPAAVPAGLPGEESPDKKWRAYLTVDENTDRLIFSFENQETKEIYKKNCSHFLREPVTQILKDLPEEAIYDHYRLLFSPGETKVAVVYTKENGRVDYDVFGLQDYEWLQNEDIHRIYTDAFRSGIDFNGIAQNDPVLWEGEDSLKVRFRYYDLQGAVYEGYYSNEFHYTSERYDKDQPENARSMRGIIKDVIFTGYPDSMLSLPENIGKVVAWSAQEYMDQEYPLLASIPDKDIWLYDDKESGRNAVLKQGGRVQVFQWWMLSPQYHLPRLYLSDIDNDGTEELICILHSFTGTGVSIQELHILEMENDGYYRDVVFSDSDYCTQLEQLVSCEYNREANQFLITDSLGTRTLPDEHWEHTFLDVAWGNWVYYEYDPLHNEMMMHLGMGGQYEKAAPPQWIADVEARLTYDGRVFTISDPVLADPQ